MNWNFYSEFLIESNLIWLPKNSNRISLLSMLDLCRCSNYWLLTTLCVSIPGWPYPSRGLAPRQVPNCGQRDGRHHWSRCRCYQKFLHYITFKVFLVQMFVSAGYFDQWFRGQLQGRCFFPTWLICFWSTKFLTNQELFFTWFDRTKNRIIIGLH